MSSAIADMDACNTSMILSIFDLSLLRISKLKLSLNLIILLILVPENCTPESKQKQQISYSNILQAFRSCSSSAAIFVDATSDNFMKTITMNYSVQLKKIFCSSAWRLFISKHGSAETCTCSGQYPYIYMNLTMACSCTI
jgi:hypothetical protein